MEKCEVVWRTYCYTMEVGVVCTGVEVMAMGKMLVSFSFNGTPLSLVWGCVYVQCMHLHCCAHMWLLAVCGYNKRI